MSDFIFFFITYFIGYFAGYFNHRAEPNVKTIITHTKNGIKKLSKSMSNPPLKTGVIKPPTAKELVNRKLPQNIKEGREAMKQTLDSIPELAEHKRLVEEFKRESRGIYG